MRTNTFTYLESLCRAKGIVCEKTRGRIEMTTPEGGTTAECDTVAEAFDTLRGDTTFSGLPDRPARRTFAEATDTLVKRIECGNGGNLTEAEEARRGALIAGWLGLPPSDHSSDRWDLPIGSKTALGLFRTMKRLVEEGK